MVLQLAHGGRECGAQQATIPRVQLEGWLGQGMARSECGGRLRAVYVKMQPVTMLERCLAYPMQRMLVIGRRIAHPQLSKLLGPARRSQGIAQIYVSPACDAGKKRGGRRLHAPLFYLVATFAVRCLVFMSLAGPRHARCHPTPVPHDRPRTLAGRLSCRWLAAEAHPPIAR